MATGALDANGIWQYGEDDSETTFSALLNKLGGSTSTTVTRLEQMGGITSAQAATARENLRVGLVPISPSSVVIATGSGSANTLGQVSFTGATAISLNDVFSTDYKNYRFIMKVESSSVAAEVNIRLRVAGADATAANYYYIKFTADSAGATATSATTAADAKMTYSSGASGAALVSDVFDPYIAAVTRMTFQSNDSIAAGQRIAHGGVRHSLATSYTGLSVIASTGNITGNIQVFGYND